MFLYSQRRKDWGARLKTRFSAKPTIRTSLIMLVLACLLPAALAQVGFAYYSFKAERQQLLEDTLARVRALTGSLDREMIAAEGAVRALGTSPALMSGDYATFYQQAVVVQMQQQADNVVLSQPSGQQIINTLRPYGTPLPMSRTPNFKKILEADTAITTNLFIGAVSKHPHFSIQIPVRRDDAVIYTLTIGMFPHRIAAILPVESAIPGQIAGVLDGNGLLVARSTGEDGLVAHRVPDKLLAQMSNRKEGYFPTKTADGSAAILLFSRSAVSQWVTYITIPQAYLTQKLWSALKWGLSISLALLAAVLTFVWFVGGVIARSITSLTAPALALGYGQSIEIGPIYLREADEVAKAMLEASFILKAAQYEAHHDKLTTLANRALFDDMLNQQRLLCERMRMKLAVLFIDLDGFKAVNDTYGHGIGDALLVSVASRLSASVRSSDVVARLGGDEFAVLLMGSDGAAAHLVAKHIIEEVSKPYHIGKLAISVSASIGISVFPDTATTSQALVQLADEAMYRAKRNGKGCSEHPNVAEV